MSDQSQKPVAWREESMGPGKGWYYDEKPWSADAQPLYAAPQVPGVAQCAQVRLATIEECAKIAETAGCGNKECMSCYGNQIAATIRDLAAQPPAVPATKSAPGANGSRLHVESDPSVTLGLPGADARSSAETEGDLLAKAQAFVDRKYVARADARQKSMGLAYVEAERQDLAREIVRFIRSLPAPPQTVGWQPIETAPPTDWGKTNRVMLWSTQLGLCVGELGHLNDFVWANVATYHGNAIENWGVTHWRPLIDGPSVSRPKLGGDDA